MDWIECTGVPGALGDAAKMGASRGGCSMVVVVAEMVKVGDQVGWGDSMISAGKRFPGGRHVCGDNASTRAIYKSQGCRRVYPFPAGQA